MRAMRMRNVIESVEIDIRAGKTVTDAIANAAYKFGLDPNGPTVAFLKNHFNVS